MSDIDTEFIEQNPSEYNWIIRNERTSDYYSNLIVKFHNIDEEMDKTLFNKVKQFTPLVLSESSMNFYNKYFFYLMKYSPLSEYKIDLHNLSEYSKLTQEQKAFLDSLAYARINMESSRQCDSINYEHETNKVNTILRDTIKVAQYFDNVFDASKADFFKLNFIQSSPSENKFILEALSSNLKTEWCREIVKREYQQNQNKLGEVNSLLVKTEKEKNTNIGQFLTETPDKAKLFLVENIETGTLINNIKERYLDKALIIDFWATWCGPCVSQLTLSQKLHKELNDVPIEFIYICTSQNSTQEDWANKILELKLSGIHLFIEKENVDSLMKAFSISGFPSYAFIDSKGTYKPGVISNMRQLDKNKLWELMNE